MLTNITNKTLQSANPKERPYEIRDTGLKGLVLRVQPSGVKTYYMVFTRGKRVKIGRADAITPQQARELGKAVLSEHYQGGDPSSKPKLAMALSYQDYIEKVYLPWLLTNLKTGRSTYDRLFKSFTELHPLTLKEINPFIIEKWRSRRKKDGVKNSSINRELADLRSLLSRALDWGDLDFHPLKKVKQSKLDSTPIVRYLSPEEEKNLRLQLSLREASIVEKREKANKWRAERGYPLLPSLSGLTFADYLKPAVLLSLHTGLRRGELFALEWSDIDLERKNLTVRADSAKSGKTRHIPLNSEALKLLKDWKSQQARESKLVFEKPDGNSFHDVRKSWANVLTASEISNFRWHDLRHSFASKLVMAGIDLNTVRELMGHADYKTTLRYAHLAPEHKASAVERLVAND